MNLSVPQEEFEISCQILGTTHFAITKLPSEKFVINHIFAITFNGILIIPTILLNAVAIKTILKSSQLKSKPCYFIILVQSMIDLAVGVFGIPLFIFFLGGGIHGISDCIAANLALRSTTLPIGISSITLSALTAERYIAILHPYAYSTQVTKKRLLIYIGVGVVVPISMTILSFRYRTLFHIGATIIETLIFLSTAFAYKRICSVVKKLARSPNRPHDPAGEENLTRMKLFFREIKQAKCCFMVVICFGVLCILPVATVVPFFGSLDKFEVLATSIWVITLGLCNSSANSVIFFWTKTMLRKEAIKMLNTMYLK